MYLPTTIEEVIGSSNNRLILINDRNTPGGDEPSGVFLATPKGNPTCSRPIFRGKNSKMPFHEGSFSKNPLVQGGLPPPDLQCPPFKPAAGAGLNLVPLSFDLPTREVNPAAFGGFDSAWLIFRVKPAHSGGETNSGYKYNAAWFNLRESSPQASLRELFAYSPGSSTPLPTVIHRFTG